MKFDLENLFNLSKFSFKKHITMPLTSFQSSPGQSGKHGISEASQAIERIIRSKQCHIVPNKHTHTHLNKSKKANVLFFVLSFQLLLYIVVVIVRVGVVVAKREAPTIAKSLAYRRKKNLAYRRKNPTVAKKNLQLVRKPRYHYQSPSQNNLVTNAKSTIPHIQDTQTI